MCAKTTPEVPSVQDTTHRAPQSRCRRRWPPGRRRRPLRACLPPGQSVLRRRGRRWLPETSVDSWHPRQHARGPGSAGRASGSDQRRITTSNSEVPEASETSVAYSPVNSEANVVLRKEYLPHPREATAARCPRTHSSFGRVNPVSTGLAVYVRTLSFPTIRLIESTCSLAALIAPDQAPGRDDARCPGVEQHQAVHLAREAHAACTCRSLATLGLRPATPWMALLRGLPPVLGIAAPPRAGFSMRMSSCGAVKPALHRAASHPPAARVLPPVPISSA